MVDPSIVFSTYLGGASDEVIQRLALHPSTNAPYVTGWTNSNNFPVVAGSYDTSYNGTNDFDVFVTKFNGAGSALDYSTYIGGSSEDRGRGISVDSSGAASIVGETWSSGFPTTSGAYDTTHNGLVDGFIAKLSADGASLLYSTFVGGSGAESLLSCTLDGSGNIYAVGSSTSTNFPVTAATALQTSQNSVFPYGSTDLVVTKVAPSGGGSSDLVYSTYLGGNADDGARAIALDSQGRICIAACTNSFLSLPTTVSGVGANNAGADDCYVAAISLGAPSTLYFGAYIGGSSFDDPTDLVIDGGDKLYICGQTNSVSSSSPPATGFPTTATAYDSTGDSNGDAFATKVDPTLSTGYNLLSTLLGGSARDTAKGIRLDGSNNVYLVGDTASSDFPLSALPLDSTLGGSSDAFVTRLVFTASPSMTLAYSTYFGGASDEEIWSIAITNRPTITIAGSSTSTGIGSLGAFDTTQSGGQDGFVTKFDFR